VCQKRFANLLRVQRKPCTYLVSRLALSPKRPNWASIWPTSPRSSIIYLKRFWSLWYVRHLPETISIHNFRAYCAFDVYRASNLRVDSHYLQTDKNGLPFDPRHLGGPSGVPKTIFEPIGRLVETVHLSCVEIYTISKWIETSFYLTHIT
jgi:hypothetical protein